MRFPKVMSCKEGINEVTLTLYMDSQLDWFLGHFEKVGILPGVAMCVFVQEFGTRYLGLDFYASFIGINQVKFLKTILVGQTVILNIKLNDDKSVVTFNAYLDNELCVSGKMAQDPSLK